MDGFIPLHTYKYIPTVPTDPYLLVTDCTENSVQLGSWEALLHFLPTGPFHLVPPWVLCRKTHIGCLL